MEVDLLRSLVTQGGLGIAAALCAWAYVRSDIGRRAAELRHAEAVERLHERTADVVDRNSAAMTMLSERISLLVQAGPQRRVG